MRPIDADLNGLPLLAADGWQMSYGERAALEGIVSQLRPHLAIEIGTATGGSLRRIAAHSSEVHSFDLVSPPPDLASLGNVTFHTGDSHVLLSQVLAEFASAQRYVDFVLVDGDHSAEGVRRDLEDLLASEMLQRTVIVLHDTTNDFVRGGIEEVDLERHPKVALVELDWVAGHLSRREPYRLQLWGGLGLVVVDETKRQSVVHDDSFYEPAYLLNVVRHMMADIEQTGEALDSKPAAELELRLREHWRQTDDSGKIARLDDEVAERERLVQQMQNSFSWRITAPLRAAKRWAMTRRPFG